MKSGIRILLAVLALSSAVFAQSFTSTGSSGSTTESHQATQAPTITPSANLVSKEALRTRLADLKRDADKAMADYISISGAMQDCQYWLDFIQAVDEAAKKADAEAKNADK